MPKPTHCKTCGQRLRLCQDCGRDISDRDVRAIRCQPCKTAANQRDYRLRLKERR